MNDKKNDYEYDVVLSFAGENRGYVEETAQYLKDRGVKVFYDDDSQSELWGKDLYEYLDETYRHKGKYCVMFISKHYAEKLWTNHERKSAQERAFNEQREYILPARFDNTEIPGIRGTVGYVNLQKIGPEELGKLVLQKLDLSVPEEKKETFRVPKLKEDVQFNPYDEGQYVIKYIGDELKKRAENISSGLSISVFDREGKTCVRVVLNGKTRYSLDMKMGGFSGDASLSFYGVEGEMQSFSSGSTNANGTIEYDFEKKSKILKLQDMSLLSSWSSEEKSYSYDAFVDALWNRICDALEASN